MKKHYLFFCFLSIFFAACEKDNNSSCSTESTDVHIVDGDNQSQHVSALLPIPLRVRLFPFKINYCTIITAHFSVLSGGGTLSTQAVVVDSEGYAETSWTLGAMQGRQEVQVVANGDTAIFVANAFETMTDPRDGQVYAVVTFGTQTWMAESLRYDIPYVWSNGVAIDTVYANNPTIYGRLYDWETIMDGVPSSSANPSGVQGICPNGWHVPSDAEFSDLEIALGMDPQDATVLGTRGTHGFAMKSTTGWKNNANGNNSSGFNAYPAGRYGGTLDFYAQTEYSNYKSSTESSGVHGWGRECNYFGAGVTRGGFSKAYAGSCRCVRD